MSRNPAGRDRKVDNVSDFVPVPNCAELTLGWRDTQGNEWSNGIAFMQGAPWDHAALNALNLAAADAFEELMLGTVCPQIFLASLRAVSLEAADAAWDFLPLATPLEGTRTGAAQAVSVCMTVTFSTELRGRSYRGRVYHSGLSTVDLQDQKHWAPSAALNVGNAYAAFVSAIEDDVTSKAVVISRRQGNVWLSEGIPTVITGYTGRIPTATQRGRSGNGKRGRTPA